MTATYTVTTERAKRISKSLAKTMDEVGGDAGKHHSALEITARLYGHASWQALTRAASAKSHGEAIPDAMLPWAAYLERRGQQLSVLKDAGLSASSAGMVLHRLRPTAGGLPFEAREQRGLESYAEDLSILIEEAGYREDWPAIYRHADEAARVGVGQIREFVLSELEEASSDWYEAFPCSVLRCQLMVDGVASASFEEIEDNLENVMGNAEGLDEEILERYDGDLALKDLVGQLHLMWGELELKRPLFVAAGRCDTPASEIVEMDPAPLTHEEHLALARFEVAWKTSPEIAARAAQLQLKMGELRKAVARFNKAIESEAPDTLRMLAAMLADERLAGAKVKSSRDVLLKRASATEARAKPADKVASWLTFEGGRKLVAPDVWLEMFQDFGWDIDAPNPYATDDGAPIGIAKSTSGLEVPIYATSEPGGPISRYSGAFSELPDSNPVLLLHTRSTSFMFMTEGVDGNGSAAYPVGLFRLDGVWQTFFMQPGGLDQVIEQHRLLSEAEDQNAVARGFAIAWPEDMADRINDATTPPDDVAEDPRYLAFLTAQIAEKSRHLRTVDPDDAGRLGLYGRKGLDLMAKGLDGVVSDLQALHKTKKGSEPARDVDMSDFPQRHFAEARAHVEEVTLQHSSEFVEHLKALRDHADEFVAENGAQAFIDAVAMMHPDRLKETEVAPEAVGALKAVLADLQTVASNLKASAAGGPR